MNVQNKAGISVRLLAAASKLPLFGFRLPLAAYRLPSTHSDRRLRKTRQRQSSQTGFTLIEVVMAVVILGIAYVAVLQNFSFSLERILRLEESKRHTLAASLELDGLLRASRKEEAPVVVDYPTYLEGSTYKLVLVASEDNRFASLKLVRREK